MISVERLGTFDDLLSGRPAEIVQVARALRSLIGELHADVTEVPRAGEGVAAYGWGERKMSESYAYIAPQRAWVNLGFYHGHLLPDPEGIVEGTGARIRHVKVRPGFTRAPLERLILLAKQERADSLTR